MITQKSSGSNRQLSTFDLGCCAALVSKGFELVSLDKTDPQRVQFIFKGGRDIEAAASKYWSGKLSGDFRAYFNNLKMLKNRIYSY